MQVKLWLLLLSKDSSQKPPCNECHMYISVEVFRSTFLDRQAVLNWFFPVNIKDRSECQQKSAATLRSTLKTEKNNYIKGILNFNVDLKLLLLFCQHRGQSSMSTLRLNSFFVDIKQDIHVYLINVQNSTYIFKSVLMLKMNIKY